MYFINAFLIALIKKHVFLTCLKNGKCSSSQLFIPKSGSQMMCHHPMRWWHISQNDKSHEIVTHHLRIKFWEKNLGCVALLTKKWRDKKGRANYSCLSPWCTLKWCKNNTSLNCKKFLTPKSVILIKKTLYKQSISTTKVTFVAFLHLNQIWRW
jgi:hypothetical protein